MISLSLGDFTLVQPAKLPAWNFPFSLSVYYPFRNYLATVKQKKNNNSNSITTIKVVNTTPKQHFFFLKGCVELCGEPTLHDEHLHLFSHQTLISSCFFYFTSSSFLPQKSFSVLRQRETTGKPALFQPGRDINGFTRTFPF